MNIIIKRMETDEEIKGKAFVHFKSWQEAYSGIVKQTYLDERTIEKSEEMALSTKNSTIIAKDGECVVGFVQYGKYNYGDLENTGEIIALVDWKNPENNNYTFKEEVWFRNHQSATDWRRADIVVYINGMAIADIELKRASVSVENAVEQLQGLPINPRATPSAADRCSPPATVSRKPLL